MKKIKYLLALCLILAAVGAFVACGNNSNVADTSMVENTQRGGSAADDAGNAGRTRAGFPPVGPECNACVQYLSRYRAHNYPG